MLLNHKSAIEFMVDAVPTEGIAVPVIARTGEVIGGLFFGHAQPGKFVAEHEELLMGIAGQAATAIEAVVLSHGEGKKRLA